MKTWMTGVSAVICAGVLVACGGGDQGAAPAGSSAGVAETAATSKPTASATTKATATTSATAAATTTAAASATATASGAATPAASASAAGGAGGYQPNGFPTEMPKDKTAIPKIDEWVKAPFVNTKKLPDGCSIRFVREWINFKCEKNPATGVPKKVTDIKDMGAEGTEVFKLEKDGTMIDLVVRSQRGKKGTATFVTDKKSFKIGYDWPAGAPFPSTIWE